MGACAVRDLLQLPPLTEGCMSERPTVRGPASLFVLSNNAIKRPNFVFEIHTSLNLKLHTELSSG